MSIQKQELEERKARVEKLREVLARKRKEDEYAENLRKRFEDFQMKQAIINESNTRKAPMMLAGDIPKPVDAFEETMQKYDEDEEEKEERIREEEELKKKQKEEVENKLEDSTFLLFVINYIIEVFIFS